MQNFYITTAIDYPNGAPHMGHAYEKIVTDFYARWYRLYGHNVHFLTGTDENGQKLIQSAQAQSMSTLDFVDEQVIKFRNLCKSLELTHTDFIRTTEKRHHDVCHNFWNKSAQKEDIYFGKYSGKYCYSCESFYTELQAPDGICPHHSKPLELKEEEGYFLKLTKYQDWIIEYIKTNQSFISPNRSYKEIISRLESEPLKDLAISRPNEGWGVVVPNDDRFVMYTWYDALINYYSALDNNEKLSTYWPCNVHVIGKDIAWFHCVIWPIMLKSVGIELPKKVYVHGMVLAEDGRKMSKSLNNGVDPIDVINQFPIDSFKYYLLRSISSHSDGAFSLKELTDKHNNELANDFGNLIMRVIKFSLKKIGPELTCSIDTSKINYSEVFEDATSHLKEMEHNKAIDKIWEAVNKVNQLINELAPWSIKDDPEKLKQMMSDFLFRIHNLSYLLLPIIPQAAQKTLNYLGVSKDICPINFKGQITYRLTEPEILFVKII